MNSMVAIGDLVEVRGGGTPSKATPAFWVGDIPWISPKDMKHWEIIDSEDKISEKAISNSSTTLIPSNAVLIVNRSGILKHTLPVGITRRPVAINQDIKALIYGPYINVDYLAHIIKAAEPIVLKWVRATTAENFSVENLCKLEIPLPPLDEQRRIAAILDKADALRRKRKRALDLLDSLTQSMFLEMFGDLSTRSGAKIMRLREVLTQIDSGWSPICLDRPAEDLEGGVLKLSCISQSGFQETENKALPPTLTARVPLELASGDILFVRKNTRELIGASAYVWEIKRRLYLSDLIFRLRPNSKLIEPVFLQAQLSTKIVRKRMADLAGGAAGSMPNISKSRLGEIDILVPSLPLQISYRVLCQKQRVMKKSATASFSAAEALFSSLQKAPSRASCSRPH